MVFFYTMYTVTQLNTGLYHSVFYWHAGSILSIYLRKVDLVYIGVDSIILYKLQYYSLYSQLSRFTTARGSSTHLVTVGPTKVLVSIKIWDSVLPGHKKFELANVSC